MSKGDWLIRHQYDQEAIDVVYTGNEYGVPDDMTGRVVLDCGGNIGTFARLCAERGARVLSVEPMLESFRMLAGNLAHFASGQIATLRAAVADRDGRTHLAHNFNPTGNSILWGAAGEEVPLIAFDRLLGLAEETFGKPIDWVKLDIEGAEYYVIPSSQFKGVREVSCEFHDEKFLPDARQRCRDCIAHLESLGFVTAEDREWRNQYGWYVAYRGVRS